MMPELIVWFIVLLGVTSGLSQLTFQEKIEIQVLGLKKEITKAMIRFESRALDYYVKRLGLLLPDLESDLAYPALPHPPGWEDSFLSYINGKADRIRYEIAHPAPEESFKAGVIYLSAMISLKNDTSDSDVTPKQIHDAVSEIIFRENHLVPAETPFPAKIAKLTQDLELNRMRRNLTGLLGNHPIPAPGSNEKLEADVREKVRRIALGKFMIDDLANIAVWEAEVEEYTALTLNLNRMLPIDTNEKVQKWFQSARIHQAMSEKFEGYLVKWHNI